MVVDKLNKQGDIFTATLCKVLLITSFMNAALRTGQTSPITVFRILSILCIPFLLLRYFKLFAKELIFMGGLFILSLLQYYIFSITSLDLLAANYVHIIFIAVVYICVKILFHLEQNYFSDNFYQFLDRFTLFTIILTFIEYSFSISIFPSTLARDCPSVFFWNENELCCAIFLMLPLYCLQWKKTRSIFILIKMFSIIFFVYAFDCKILMLAILLMFILFFFFTNDKLRKHYKSTFLYICIFLGLSVVLFFSIDFNIPSGKQYDVPPTFSSAVREPVMHILKLERFYSAGSIFDRADAVIIGLQNLLKTGGFGIGLGGCLNILDGELATAKSMHNIFIQCIVELGIGFLIIYWVYISKLYSHATSLSWFKLCFFLTLPLSSSISSGGIMSNYMFWGIVFYVFLLKQEPWEKYNTNMKTIQVPHEN